MPIDAKKAWAELSRLKLLSPSGNSPGIFIVDESPFQEEGAAATAKSGHDFIAGRIFPNSDIYKEGAYRLEMTFAPGYPFKPPNVRFTTPIYHPNVDKDAAFCDNSYGIPSGIAFGCACFAKSSLIWIPTIYTSTSTQFQWSFVKVSALDSPEPINRMDPIYTITKMD
ncbi:unnamed protein product [Rotaria sp. Silwood2]|nr:unnamed protein product [Rotaria sp. Silwood2]CAF4212258.1 unnamed protein product [Rotaria sp. Silwood2]